MNFRWGHTPAALGAGFALAVLVILAALTGNLILAAAVPIGLAGAAIVVHRPFLGVWLIALFTQLDAIANTLFSGLPVSGVKLLTALTLAGVVIASYREPRKDRFGPDDPVVRSAVLYCIVLLISFLFVEDLALGFWSVRRLGSLFILLYLVVRLVTSLALVRAMVFAVLVSTLVSGLIVVADWIMGTHLVAKAQAAVTSEWQGMARSSGASDYNPTTAATMLLTGTACAMMLLVRTSRWRWLTAATVVAGCAGVVLSYARSSGLVLAGLILWLLFKYRGHRRFPVAIAAGLLVLAVSIPMVPATYWERQATLTDLSSDLSLRRRLGYNIIGVHLLADYPLIGVGPGNYRVHYMDHKYRWMPGRGVVPRQLHNMYLEVATESGLVGFACFGGMLFLALRSMNRVRKSGKSREIRDIGEALFFAYVGLLVVSVFVPNEYNKYVWIFTGLGAAMGRVAAREESGDEDAPLKSPLAGRLTPAGRANGPQ